MRISRLEELRKIHLKIKEVEHTFSEDEIKENEKRILTAIDTILELSELARLEGLILLDEVAMKIDVDSSEEVLRQLLLLIVSGTDPEEVEDIGMVRYYCNLYDGYDALTFYIYLEGVLSVQAGDNIRELEERLKSMLPKKLYIEYIKGEEEHRIEKERQKAEAMIKELCETADFLNENEMEEGYHISKIVNYTICQLSDVNIQKIMRYVDNVELSFAVKGMRGETMKRIFDNLSVRLKKIVAEDVKYSDNVKKSDVLEALRKLLNIIVRLINDGEIVGDYEYLKPFIMEMEGKY